MHGYLRYNDIFSQSTRTYNSHRTMNKNTYYIVRHISKQHYWIIHKFGSKHENKLLTILFEVNDINDNTSILVSIFKLHTYTHSIFSIHVHIQGYDKLYAICNTQHIMFNIHVHIQG